MKRCIVLALIICLTVSLTACMGKPASSEIRSPEYDPKPTPDALAVSVDGKNISGVYTHEGVYYIHLNHLCDALGGEIDTEIAMKEPYKATMTLRDHTYAFSNTETVLQEGEQAHPLVYEPLYDGDVWYMPLEPIMSLLGLYLVQDDGAKRSYSTSEPIAIPSADQIPAGVNIPVLMYHALGDNPWSSITGLFVRPAEMEKQLKYLQDNGFTTVTFEDMNRLSEIQKPVMLTFDDGYDDNYTLLFPLLKKYNAKATIFVITDLIGTEHYLSEAQIREMSDSGYCSIQSHTATHPNLSDIGGEALEKELTVSKDRITEITGKTPFVLCYPNGAVSAAAIEKIKAHYSFGLLMNGGLYTTGQQNVYRIPRFYIARDNDINTFINKVN